MAFAAACLGFNALLYLVATYFCIFDPVTLFSQGYNKKIDLKSNEGQVLMVVLRYLGGACFVFSFLFGHMIPKTDRHSAGLRTVAMTSGIMFALAGYRAHLESGVSDQMKQASKRTALVFGSQLTFSVLAIAMLPPKEAIKQD